MEQTTKFSLVKSYFSHFNLYDCFSRKDMLAHFREDSKFLPGDQRIDILRRLFTAAGYLDIYKKGIYMIIKKIPGDLTQYQLTKEAYPNQAHFSN